MSLKENVCYMKKIYYMIIYIGISNYFQSCIMNYLLEVFIIIINDNFNIIFFMKTYKSLYTIAKFNHLKDYYSVLNISKTND